MGTGNFSRVRLARMHDVMSGYVERGEVPGIVTLVSRRGEVHAAVPGRYGWDGGYGTSWSSDPNEDMVAILMTQRAGFPQSSGVHLDFWTSAYQAIDD